MIRSKSNFQYLEQLISRTLKNYLQCIATMALWSCRFLYIDFLYLFYFFFNPQKNLVKRFWWFTREKLPHSFLPHLFFRVFLSLFFNPPPPSPSSCFRSNSRVPSVSLADSIHLPCQMRMLLPFLYEVFIINRWILCDTSSLSLSSWLWWSLQSWKNTPNCLLESVSSSISKRE